jgi:hypothetical protein
MNAKGRHAGRVRGKRLRKIKQWHQDLQRNRILQSGKMCGALDPRLTMQKERTLRW